MSVRQPPSLLFWGQRNPESQRAKRGGSLLVSTEVRIVEDPEGREGNRTLRLLDSGRSGAVYRGRDDGVPLSRENTGPEPFRTT